MARYTIFGVPYGGEEEVELAQCDTNPEAVADGYCKKTLKGPIGNARRAIVAKWVRVRIRDNEEQK